MAILLLQPVLRLEMVEAEVRLVRELMVVVAVVVEEAIPLPQRDLTHIVAQVVLVLKVTTVPLAMDRMIQMQMAAQVVVQVVLVALTKQVEQSMVLLLEQVAQVALLALVSLQVQQHLLIQQTVAVALVRPELPAELLLVALAVVVLLFTDIFVQRLEVNDGTLG
jgi:hypothetical protein